ncbi:amidohydrolase [Paeniglutamicibacter kerguelensis]|uniref:Amidohydrolase YtcJ n=1 Tax=Paeniglutamicibacter kerguelensis TaxID=254788 RepID=A0ABS4XJE7_9MICC|nr:amidohydrolase [Paeniglutamicibacter kerguelensis]MBP2388403.1 putative amidohydrolase YtcJ [Paeniglutamicibacter kerguelensis]
MTIEFAPDLILTNGNIVTVDKEFSTAEAVAVYDGKIVAIGGTDEVSQLAGKRTKRVDLGGKTLVPGQMDNHVHFSLAGMDALDGEAKVNIATLQSIDEILREIKARVDATPAGEWIGTSCMYRGALKDGRFPTRHDLDKVSPDHPVYIFQSGKNVICNSYALRLAGITRDTENPTEPEGWIVRDNDGEPTGHLIAGAGDMARKAWWKVNNQPIKKWDFLYFDQETQIKAMMAQQKIYHQCGVVGVRDMGTSIDELEALTEAHRRGLLKIRTDVLLGLPARYMSEDEILNSLNSYFGPKQHLGDSMLRLNGIKIVAVNDGWWAHSKEKLKFIINEYNRRNWNMAIHINTGGSGDSTETVLTALEEAAMENPIAGRRISFEHGFGLQEPQHYERARKLGAIIASNSLLAYYASARSMRMNEIMEQVRIAKMSDTDPWRRTVRDWGMPIKSWMDGGLTVTGGSDNPAVVYDPDRPFLSQYSALTGDTMAGVLLPGQQITREQMLRMYTINNAYACWQEDVRGSIELGKLADFTVLDRDILTCADQEIAELQVLQTYVGGELVHER